MSKPHSVTSLPVAPQDDRKHRTRQYLIAMGVRTLCILACFFVPGWWVLIPLTGAVVLPYLAVMLANVTDSQPGETIAAPGYDALPPGSSRQLS